MNKTRVALAAVAVGMVLAISIILSFTSFMMENKDINGTDGTSPDDEGLDLKQEDILFSGWNVSNAIDFTEMFDVAREWSKDAKLASFSVELNPDDARITISSANLWFISWVRGEFMSMDLVNESIDTYSWESRGANWVHSRITPDLREFDVLNLSTMHEIASGDQGSKILSMSLRFSYHCMFVYSGLVQWSASSLPDGGGVSHWYDAQTGEYFGATGSGSDGISADEPPIQFKYSAFDDNNTLLVTVCDREYEGLRVVLIQTDPGGANLKYLMDSPLENYTVEEFITWSDEDRDRHLSVGDMLTYDRSEDDEDTRDLEMVLLYQNVPFIFYDL